MSFTGEFNQSAVVCMALYILKNMTKRIVLQDLSAKVMIADNS